jgi:YidC/Oxa1 family membrane protein insertase
MERRAALAIGLSLLILYLYQAFVLKPGAPVPPAQTTAPASAPAATSQEATSSSAGQASAPVEAARPTAVVSESAERRIVVDNGKVEAVFSNRGGRLLSWRLKGYLDGTKQAAVDLVPADIPANLPRPFSLALGDAQLSSRANDGLYRVTVNGGDAGDTLDVTGEKKTLVFEFEDEGGLKVRKELVFEPQSYLLTLTTSVSHGDRQLKPTIEWGPGLGDVGAASAGGSFFTGNYVQPPSAIYERDGDVARIAPSSLAEQRQHDGRFVFAGIDDHYFLAAVVDPGQARIEYDAVSVPGPDDTTRTFVSQAITPSGDSGSLRFFIGPKELQTLRAAGANGALARAINFGMFTWLVLPLLEALKWLYGFIGNYGWAIICLTIVINLAMFPLRHKSLVSMRKMQALQPQIKAIQERYADLKMTDPARQKMNTEVMNLYRERGVNPAAGCVPMLLTMPVLLAFYSMLSQSIELRGADFGFWIHDLSLKDPYYVTPLLMGATMFWQQWVTPTTADPAQQRMMMFMPIALTGIFLSLPSGLAIYYLVTNLFQISQQYLTNYSLGKPSAPPSARPVTDGRMKNAGSGKSPGAARLKQGERKA